MDRGDFIIPEMFKAITEFGVTGRAVKHNLLQGECWNPRDFTFDKHKTVDDRPYGGGPGMLMMVQPLRDAIHAASKRRRRRKGDLPFATGRKLDQGGVTELAQNQKLILVCGRYEGIDERLIQTEIDEEWSIGDYVLTGGELPAMTLIDAVARFIPGVLGKQASAEEGFFRRWFIRLSALHQTGSVRRINCTSPMLMSGHHEEIPEMAIKAIATKNVAPTP